MFNSIYNFFKTRKILLASILILILGFSLFFISKLKFTEDISDMIPTDKELDEFTYVSKNIKMNDKIILNIFLKDTTQSENTEILILFADTISNQISKNCKGKIQEIRSTVKPDLQEKVYDIYYRNLPIYLTDNDYLRIDSLLSDSLLKKTIEADFQNLISPAGMVSKKFITRDPLSITPIALKRLKSLQFDDNFEIYSDHIFTKDKKNLFVFVNSNFTSSQTSDNNKLIDEIKNVLNENKKLFPEIEVQIFGAPVVAGGNAKQIKSDILLTVTIAMIFLFAFISFFYKRIDIFFIIFLPVIFGAVVAIAAIYFISGKVSGVSLGIGSVLVGISIDYSLHIFTHFRKTNNSSKIFSDITGSVLMSSITTASAFLCLLFVSSGALHDLGLFAGISVFASSIFALIVLPHFYKERTEKELKSNIIEKFTVYKFHKNKYIVAFGVIATIFSLFFVGKAEFDADMDKMNYMSDELKLAEKNLNKSGNIALRSMYVTATGKNIEESLRNNEKISEIIDSLKSRNVINSFSNVNPVLISDSLQNIRLKKWKTFWTPEKIINLKENLIKYGAEFGFNETAFEKFFKFLDEDKSLMNSEDKKNLKEIFLNELLTENKDITTSVTLIKLKKSANEKVFNALKNQKNIVIVDKTYLTNKIITVLKKDFNLLIIISSIAVFVILLLYFGRIELTVITYLPMFLSWIWTLAIMNIFGQKFTIFNIIISTFIFGLGIDYSIFIVNGLLQKYRYGTPNINSYKTSVLLSGITTIAGIGVLIFAKHPALKSIAFLSVVGIISTIFLVYTLLPLLFNFLIKQQGKLRTQPVVFKDLFFSILIFLIFALGSLITVVFWLILQLLPFKLKYKKIVFRYWLLYLWHAIVYIPFNVKKFINNPYKETLKNPAVIIANHQAHIDIPLILMLSPKIIVLTNDWVQNNIFYGKIVKFAEFYPVSKGIEELIPHLQEKFNEGYSILVYPEGTRSENLEIKRFHKGAFYIAEKLNADILPIIIHGTGNSVPKGEPFLKSGQIGVNILDRKKLSDFGIDNKEQAKNFRQLIIKEYKLIREKYENVDFYKKKLISNYIYKTPILENYFRVKIRLEDNYRVFDKLVPKKGIITDIGCGYGFLAYMLNFVSPERKILGLDYDSNKILTAQNNISKNENVNFKCVDVINFEFQNSDVFIINDVLHYMPFEEQKTLISKCLSKLNSGGKLIIRDGNSEMKKKHKGTLVTEYFSTKFLKFNKTNFDKLHFTSFSQIKKIAEENNFIVETIDNTVLTSNQIYILKRNI